MSLDTVTFIGSIDGHASTLLGDVPDLAVSPERREVFVLDALAWSVKVYDFSGGFQRSSGGRGEGPGEPDDALAAIAVARDTVVVADFDRLHVFAPTGDLVRTERFRPQSPIAVILAIDPVVSGWIVSTREVEGSRRQSEQVIRHYLVDLSNFEEKTVITEAEFLVDGGIPGLRRYQWAVASDDIVEGEYSYYALRRYAVDGALRQVDRIDREPVPFTRRGLEMFEEASRASCSRTRTGEVCLAGLEDLVAEVEELLGEPLPVIASLVGAPEGDVFVMRGDGDPNPFDDAGTGRFDIIDSEGTVTGSGNLPQRFRPEWFGSGMVWGVLLDDLDIPFVRGFRLVDGQ